MIMEQNFLWKCRSRNRTSKHWKTKKTKTYICSPWV